jgi:hypothetical protein
MSPSTGSGSDWFLFPKPLVIFHGWSCALLRVSFCFLFPSLCVSSIVVAVSSYCCLQHRRELLIVLLTLCLHSAFICCLCLYSMFLCILCILCHWGVLVAGIFKRDYFLEFLREGFVSRFL